MIYGLNDAWPITIFPSIISTETCSWCHDEDVHFASSCRKFRRELAMTSAFSPFSFWNTASKGAVIKAVWEAAWGKSKRGRDGEREGERERENRENLNTLKYERCSALLPCNKGIGAHQTVLSTPAAFCQTVLTSQSNVLLFHSFHSASATRGLLRENWLYHDLDKVTS